MKKVRFSPIGSSGKGFYAVLFAGILAIGAITAVGYRVAVGSATKNILPNLPAQDELIEPDYSQVDKLLEDIAKQPEEEAASSLETDVNSDLGSELEALYYEQAKMFPVEGEIIGEFSWGELVKTTGGVWRTHDGIDIAAENGSPVRAMTSGSVTSIYSDPVWGNCMVIDHGDTVIGCYYGLAPDISVNIGDKVAAGQTLGTVGSTADIESDMEPHIHFALRYEGSWIDPVSYIEPMK
ncbi:MAG TPA: M23 family metallopeptidase [Candidatus Faeciplasma avium]|uniref:M23 family metallopeptidase n=1 Tax=Candidatus Faeciplasma avium TaxID=2840798 RepID=A0A9D1NQU9_9FIRM|nr:M23 family metallopeptidase [Candidatus Faeciplasma avium]